SQWWPERERKHHLEGVIAKSKHGSRDTPNNVETNKIEANSNDITILRMVNDIVFKIEVKSLLEDLSLAWERGFRQVELECHNALPVETPLVGRATNSRMVELELIYGILYRRWKVRIRYVPSAQNEVVDHMAKLDRTRP
ncbi:hypothetical protein Golax_003233, partial [Gossypium laxum]|nr:hypothetical protein [Gossypium laxum]